MLDNEPSNNGGTEINNNGETDQRQHSVHAISVKPPPFYLNNPEVWFKTMESQFQLAKISSPDTRFHHVLAALPENIAAQLPDDIPAEYGRLKTEVLAISEKTNYEKVAEAIGKFSLDINEKPSMLLKRISNKIRQSGLQNTQELVAMRFTEALPANMRMVIAAVPGSAHDKAQVADSLTSILQTDSGICAIGTSGPTCSGNSSNNLRTQYNNNNHSSLHVGVKPFFQDQRPRICRAHIYFGNSARNCTRWCQWPDKRDTRITTSAQQTPHQSPTKQHQKN